VSAIVTTGSEWMHAGSTRDGYSVASRADRRCPGLKRGKRVGERGVGRVAVRAERSSIRSQSSCAGGRGLDYDDEAKKRGDEGGTMMAEKGRTV
jgi:hypothetical protein